jgi:hypothetical protein
MNCSFQYFFNAIHYCIYLEEVYVNKTIKKSIGRTGSFLLKNILPSKYAENIRNKLHSNFAQAESYLYDDNYGFFVSTSHHIFGAFSAGYLSFFSFILIGYADRICTVINQIVTIIIIALPIAIGYIPIYRMVLKNDIYREFFKQFKMEDNNWRSKWTKITIAFCIGSVIMEVLGFFLMVLIRSIDTC